LNDSTNIEAEIASSFRFPTVSELLFSGETPRGTTIGNAELEPEESIGYQLSLSHNFSSTLTSSLSAYLYNINNYIERVTRADESRTFKNTDSVQIKGIEFTTNWQPNEQFNTSIGLQWQQGKNTLNQTVDDSLPAAIKWAFQWDPPHKTLAKFSINNSINYRLSKNNAGPSEVYLTNALLWNTSFSYEWSQRIRMSFSVNNVLNENYKATADEDASFQPERTAGLQLKWFY
jgi:iron complex outermembrane receptor protein